MNRRQFSRTLLGAAAGWTLGGGLPLPRPAAALAQSAPLRVDGERLLRQLRTLAPVGRNPAGGADRVAYSEADREARAYVMGLMREAGLEVRVDAAANIVGRRAGTEPGLAPIGFGSHIDSVPNGGHYDGPVGSLAAVEVARTLAEQDVSTRHPLEVVVFSNEEGGLVGSEAMIGALAADDLALVSHSGRTVAEGIRFLGGDPDRIAEAVRRPGDLAAWVELHIEQGAVLEEAGEQIGVVQGIVGIGWWDVLWEGVANHAGTTPMDRRQDALAAAARWIADVQRVAREMPGRQVATVGRIEAHPGAPNVIPGRVETSLEIRDLDAAKIQRVFGELRARAESIARETGTTVRFTPTISLPPAPADPAVQDAVAAAASELGLSARRMPSGAGHDTQSIARIAPAGMIFIPSVGGISHSPDEFSRPEDIVHGANVLLHTVLRLDR